MKQLALFLITLPSMLLLATVLFAAPKPDTVVNKLEPCECGNVKNIHRFGNIYLAGQPQADDFRIAHEMGIKSVLSIREQSELDWDEKKVVEDLGMKYFHVPFRGPEKLTDNVFAKTRKLFTDKSKHPIMVHCGSANRVGAVWLAHRVLDGGITKEAALAEAKKVGLRTPGYIDKVHDYIERMQKKKD